MTEEEAALLKGAPKDESSPMSAMQRIAVLEAKVEYLNAALRRAFGERWMDERKGDERTG